MTPYGVTPKFVQNMKKNLSTSFRSQIKGKKDNLVFSSKTHNLAKKGLRQMKSKNVILFKRSRNSI